MGIYQHNNKVSKKCANAPTCLATFQPNVLVRILLCFLHIEYSALLATNTCNRIIRNQHSIFGLTKQ